MKERTLIYLVILLIVVNVAALATIIYQRVSNPWSRFERARPAAFDVRTLKRLRLSQQDRQRLFSSRVESDSLTLPLHRKIADMRHLLFTELDRDTPDTLVINDLLTKIGEAQVNVQKTLVNTFLRHSSTLQPQQKEILLRLIEERARWHERRMPPPGEGMGRGR